MRGPFSSTSRPNDDFWWVVSLSFGCEFLFFLYSASAYFFLPSVCFYECRRVKESLADMFTVMSSSVWDLEHFEWRFCLPWAALSYASITLRCQIKQATWPCVHLKISEIARYCLVKHYYFKAWIFAIFCQSKMSSRSSLANMSSVICVAPLRNYLYSNRLFYDCPVQNKCKHSNYSSILHQTNDTHKSRADC